MDRADSVKRVEEVEVEVGAVEGCRRLRTAGYTLAVITNQSAVGRGWMTETDLDAVNQELNQRLGHAVNHWYICPHGPDAGCRCRKPDTLLLERAHAELGFRASDTWFVADAARDVEAARRFGVRPALVRTGKGSAAVAAYPDVPVWDDLADFARSVADADAR